MIKSGEYRHYATIETPTQTGTGLRGQPIIAWTAFACDVPIAIKPLAGKEAEIARQLVATATHRIKLRHYAGLSETMRINFAGKYFNIGWVKDDFIRHETELVCTEQKSGAA